MAKHELLGGKVSIYKRARSRFWQCATHIHGESYRKSTGCEGLSQASDFAEEWYLQLRAELRPGGTKDGRTFRQEAVSVLQDLQTMTQRGLKAEQEPRRDSRSFAEVAEVYMKELRVLTQGERSLLYVELQDMRMRVHVLPYFGTMQVTEIIPGTLQDYRMERAGAVTHMGKPPTRSTIHQELVVVRQVLKTAHRRGWLPMLPDLSNPFKSSKKIRHRAWFSLDEYKQFYEATRERAKFPKKERWRWASEQMHDYVLFMANTGLRPDEAALLEVRDVSIIRENEESILLIEVRGKRGIGYCKSMAGAVRPFQRVVERNRLKPDSRIFPGSHRNLFNEVDPVFRTTGSRFLDGLQQRDRWGE